LRKSSHPNYHCCATIAVQAVRDKESQRRAAFVEAAARARRLTVEQARDRETTQAILEALDAERSKDAAEALAEEGAKLMLFSAHPAVPRLTQLCTGKLHWESFWKKERPPEPETVAAVLSDFLANLREALLDQPAYHDLVGRETLRALREIVAELRPVAYDSEATYRAQVAEMYRQLEFVGIPELKERRPITVEDIFIRLRAERQAKVAGTPEEVLAQRVRSAATAKSQPRVLTDKYWRSSASLHRFYGVLITGHLSRLGGQGRDHQHGLLYLAAKPLDDQLSPLGLV
jgi:hypothetical protein